MNSNTINKCRFCYNYKRTPPSPSTVDSCCQPNTCATNESLASISSLTNVVNNNTRTTERSLLLGQQHQYFQAIYSSAVSSTVSDTIHNSTTITKALYSQLLQVQKQRYEPYQPYIPPIIPSSVVQLQMATVNVGVPQSFFTIMDCKGVQSVTT